MENQPNNIHRLIPSGTVESVLTALMDMKNDYRGVIVVGVRKDGALTLHGTQMSMEHRAYLAAFLQEYISNHFRTMPTEGGEPA